MEIDIFEHIMSSPAVSAFAYAIVAFAVWRMLALVYRTSK
jgi:hypothetical protein